MMRQKPRHAPDKMTVAYNRTQAFMKISIAPLDKLDERMIDSIARTHKVPVEDLKQRLDERRRRECAA